MYTFQKELLSYQNLRQRVQTNASSELFCDAPHPNARHEKTIRKASPAALEVRAIYSAFYKRLTKNTRRPKAGWAPAKNWGVDIFGNPLDRPVWQKIANFISSLNLPYFEFIREKFRARKGKPPLQRDMFSDMGTEELELCIQEAAEDYAYRLNEETGNHEVICKEQSWEWLAEVPTHVLARQPDDRRSCLFLYSLAVRDCEPSWAQFYQADAFRQYLTEPWAYRVGWSSFLPRNIYYDALAYLGAQLPPALRRWQQD